MGSMWQQLSKPLRCFSSGEVYTRCTSTSIWPQTWSTMAGNLNLVTLISMRAQFNYLNVCIGNLQLRWLRSPGIFCVVCFMRGNGLGGKSGDNKRKFIQNIKRWIRSFFVIFHSSSQIQCHQWPDSIWWPCMYCILSLKKHLLLKLSEVKLSLKLSS